MRFIWYNLLLALAFPYLLLRLLRRLFLDRSFRPRLLQRFGFYFKSSRFYFLGSGCIWLHAVSVGEVRACEYLVNALRQAHPDLNCLITVMTPTGFATAQQLWPSNRHIKIVYLPYDYPAPMKRFLKTFVPRCALFVETEIWPNALRYLAHYSIPAYLINARLSEKSARRYRNFDRFTLGLVSQSMRSFTAIYTQTAEDLERYRPFLSAKNSLSVMGNMKFDVKLAPNLVALGKQWRSALAPERAVIVVASTRPGEEALFLDALEEHASNLDQAVETKPLWVIVPRHPERFKMVTDLACQCGNGRFQVHCRSEMPDHSPKQVLADTDILIGDSIAEMGAYYTLADVAVIGGSFFEAYGGQNPIEALLAGIAVFIGPHTRNFSYVVQEGSACGAIQQWPDFYTVIRESLKMVQSKEGKSDVLAQQLLNKHRGATQYLLDQLLPQIESRF